MATNRLARRRATTSIALPALAALLGCASKPHASTPDPTHAPTSAPPTPPPASCPDGRAALLIRDDKSHCVWACDPEADEPCPHEFACVGIGRKTDDTLERYCETPKGPGIADGVAYPEDWRPKSAPK